MMERFLMYFSGLALLVLSPLLVPIVLILKFSGGKIFFCKSVLVKVERYLSYLNLQLCLKIVQTLVLEQ